MDARRAGRSIPSLLVVLAVVLAGPVVPGAQASPEWAACVSEACRPGKRDCKKAWKQRFRDAVAGCTAARARRARCRRDARRSRRVERSACRSAYRDCEACCRWRREAEGKDCVGGGPEVRSLEERDRAPVVSESDRAAFVVDNTSFGLDLYRTLAPGERNLFISPSSISIALAMTYAGAAGNTAIEMAEALHFALPPGRLHAAFNWLDLELSGRGEGAQGADGEPFRLEVVNAIWGQTGYELLPSYLDTIATSYGAGLRLLDFFAAPEPSRIAINAWVAQQTADRIEELLPVGAITRDTLLVLTNAVYFNAAWAYPFDRARTADGSFLLEGGGTTIVPFMRQTQEFGYVDGDGYVAVELPYDGDELSMIAILPDPGELRVLEQSLDAAAIDAIVDSMTLRNMNLALPRFEFKSEYDLVAALSALGMKDAFSGVADFSGIDGSRGLSIQGVFHDTFVSVSEPGTEAAAATAVVIGKVSVPPPPIDVSFDRPFIFLIRDLQTRSVVFLGRVLNPS
jgi:serpin B